MSDEYLLAYTCSLVRYTFSLQAGIIISVYVVQPKKPKPTPSATPASDSNADKPAKKSKAKPKASPEDGNDNKGKAKKPRKKKDKNEPKRGLSAYLFYSQANREKVSSNLWSLPRKLLHVLASHHV